MNLFIDCEWNSFKGELISMALVCPTAEWYVEVTFKAEPDPWVMENVIPHLSAAPVDHEYAARSLQRFLERFDSVHIVADWPEDIERFCDLLVTGPGTRINTPPLTMEIVRIDPVSSLPHHALHDARALMEMYNDQLRTHP